MFTCIIILYHCNIFIDIQYKMKNAGQITTEILHAKEFDDGNGFVTVAFWASHDNKQYSTKLCQLVKGRIDNYYDSKPMSKAIAESRDHKAD